MDVDVLACPARLMVTSAPKGRIRLGRTLLGYTTSFYLLLEANDTSPAVKTGRVPTQFREICD